MDSLQTVNTVASPWVCFVSARSSLVCPFPRPTTISTNHTCCRGSSVPWRRGLYWGSSSNSDCVLLHSSSWRSTVHGKCNELEVELGPLPAFGKIVVLFSNTERDFTLVIYKKRKRKKVGFWFSMNFRGKWGFRCLILKVKHDFLFRLRWISYIYILI